MKKKRIVKIIIILLLLVVIVGVVLIYQVQKRKREEWAQQQILKIEYRQQNRALPREGNLPIREDVYVGYDVVDEEGLYVRLMAYNEHMTECKNEKEVELNLADFEEYLSSEYNEDGSLRIYEGYEHIQAYMNWYHEESGDRDIENYWNELTKIAMNYYLENVELVWKDPVDMNIAQLQELIKKKNDSDYQINIEIMRE